MLFAPLEGWRCVKVKNQRTSKDYAHVLKDLSDAYFANAEKIILVQDNLNTHTPASLYEAFQPGGAAFGKALHGTITPKPGSWLNMAEAETRYPGQAMPRSAHQRSSNS